MCILAYCRDERGNALTFAQTMRNGSYLGKIKEVSEISILQHKNSYCVDKNNQFQKIDCLNLSSIPLEPAPNFWTENTICCNS